MKTINKVIIGIIIIAVIISISLFANRNNQVDVDYQKETNEKSIGANVQDGYNIIGSTSTTTPEFIVADTATTTTGVISRKNVDLEHPGNLKINLTSTSSQPTLNYTLWYADENSEADRTWYAYTGTTDSSDILDTIGISPKIFNLLYATSTEESTFISRIVPLPNDVSSKYMKLKYQVINADAELDIELTTNQ